MKVETDGVTDPKLKEETDGDTDPKLKEETDGFTPKLRPETEGAADEKSETYAELTEGYEFSNKLALLTPPKLIFAPASDDKSDETVDEGSTELRVSGEAVVDERPIP